MKFFSQQMFCLALLQCTECVLEGMAAIREALRSVDTSILDIPLTSHIPFLEPRNPYRYLPTNISFEKSEIPFFYFAALGERHSLFLSKDGEVMKGIERDTTITFIESRRFGPSAAAISVNSALETFWGVFARSAFKC